MFKDFWEKIRLGITAFIVGIVIITGIVLLSLIIFSNFQVLVLVVILFVVVFVIGNVIYKRK